MSKVLNLTAKLERKKLDEHMIAGIESLLSVGDMLLNGKYNTVPGFHLLVPAIRTIKEMMPAYSSSLGIFHSANRPYVLDFGSSYANLITGLPNRHRSFLVVNEQPITNTEFTERLVDLHPLSKCMANYGTLTIDIGDGKSIPCSVLQHGYILLINQVATALASMHSYSAMYWNQQSELAFSIRVLMTAPDPYYLDFHFNLGVLVEDLKTAIAISTKP